MVEMTIKDTGWSRLEMILGWLDEETQAVAEEAAETEIAYIILNVHKVVGSGWTYSSDGIFSGPYRGGGFDPVSKIGQLVTEAVDYTLEHIDEIRADATN